MMSDYFDSKKIQRIHHKLSKKSLVQIEGATCSGKTTFVLGVSKILEQKGFKVMVIEEAARLVLIRNRDLLEQLVKHRPNSKCWRIAKINLQQKILAMQLDHLERFGDADNFEIALMDRGGASTFFHMSPLLSDCALSSFENVCKKITQMSDLVILLPQLGVFQHDSFRFQRNLDEVLDEFFAIKYFLDICDVNYLELPSSVADVQAHLGFQHILQLS